MLRAAVSSSLSSSAAAAAAAAIASARGSIGWTLQHIHIHCCSQQIHRESKKLTPSHFETRAQLLLRWSLVVAPEWHREKMGVGQFWGKIRRSARPW